MTMYIISYWGDDGAVYRVIHTDHSKALRTMERLKAQDDVESAILERQTTDCLSEYWRQ